MLRQWCILFAVLFAEYHYRPFILSPGVFTGCSAMAIALALPESGKVVACDVSREYTDIGKPFWAEVSPNYIMRLVFTVDREKVCHCQLHCVIGTNCNINRCFGWV